MFALPACPPLRLHSARLAAGIAGLSATCLAAPAWAGDVPDAIAVSPAELAALDTALAGGTPDTPVPTPDVIDLAVAAPAPVAEVTPIRLDLSAGQEDSAPAGPDQRVERARRPYASFGADVASIKWELGAVAAYYTAINAPKLFMNPRAPRFKREGWFGLNTTTVGVDKLAHAYSAYVISDVLYYRLKRNTGGAPGIQYTAAALAAGIMLYTEAFDSIEPDGGWSWEDVAMNTAGAAFSVLRNSVPGLDQKLDYRLMIVPNDKIFVTKGKAHFQQQRYFFALKLSGFEAFKRSPLRLLELHLGYHGDDFLNSDRDAGIRPKRHIFVGAGINLRELFFKNSRSRIGRAVGEGLDYFQPPYTAVHTHLTD